MTRLVRDQIDFEISALEMWLKLWKKDAKAVWYRDARDHIVELRRLWEAFK